MRTMKRWWDTALDFELEDWLRFGYWAVIACLLIVGTIIQYTQ